MSSEYEPLKVSRRDAVKGLAAVSLSVFFQPLRTAFAGGSEESERVRIDAATVLQQPEALADALWLSEAELLDTSIPLGWIDTSPVWADHPAFWSGKNCVIDVARSKNAAGTSAFTGVAEHATWALQFAVQKTAAEKNTFLSAGLSQDAWTDVVFTCNPELSLTKYAALVRSLVDSSVGVIGSIPTWTTGDNGITTEAIALVREAYEYARSRNVIIVLPAGNRGIAIAAPPDGHERVLHELKRELSNVVCAGGVTDTLTVPTWNAGGPRGSNYGEGYITVVSPIINRHVPAAGKQVISGTTFAAGDLTSCIQAVQARIGRDAAGNLPDHEKVISCITDTARTLGSPERFGSGLLQMQAALAAAV